MATVNEKTANNLSVSGHQGGIDTGVDMPLLIEEYSGKVVHSLRENTFISNMFDIQMLKGADTITNKAIGETVLQVVIPGQRPDDHAPSFDNIKVKVDRQILARATQAQIHAFTDDINVRNRVGIEHGRAQAEYKDKTFLGQLIKGAQISYATPNRDNDGKFDGTKTNNSGWTGLGANATYSEKVRTAPEGHVGGTSLMLANAGDENDPDAFVLALMQLRKTMKEKNVNVETGIVYITPEQEFVLLQNDKLINTDFSSGNGNFAGYMVKGVAGFRIKVTNHFPDNSEVGVQHMLSHAGNDNAYNVTQADANCVAVYVQGAEALLAGQLQTLETDVFYNKTERQWFIDAATSYGCTPNKCGALGAIFKYSA